MSARPELLAVLALAAACGSTRRSEPISGPMALEAGDLERGQLVFMQKCDACHIHGEGGLGPSLNEKPLPAFAMRLQVRRGLGAMPAFSEDEISDRDLDACLDYVRELRKQR